MTAVLIPHPRGNLQRARELVAHPDFHSAGAVLDACEHLEAWGDWTDAQRARELHKAIVRDTVSEVNRRSRRRRLVRDALIPVCALTILAALAWPIGTVVAPFLTHNHGAAHGEE